jgi:hypothetical protein
MSMYGITQKAFTGYEIKVPKSDPDGINEVWDKENDQELK